MEDDANTINMKLFPNRAHPPPVKAWDVPITKIKFSSVMDDTWDLTMKKVIKHVDGIRDVRRIAHDADVALDLTKNALQHLLYYDAILILDMFMFGNIYAPTPDIHDFISNRDNLQDECANYVFINGPRLEVFFLHRLFTSLCTSRTLKEWLKLHMDQGFMVMDHIDVRRFIQFGVIKGLIYRVHKFAVSAQHLELVFKDDAATNVTGDILEKYLDGCHTFDQIMVERNMGDEKIMDHLRKKHRKRGVDIIYR